MNRKQINEARVLCDAATPGPLHVKRVDHDDGITYEVSGPDQTFHVVFSEVNYADVDTDRLYAHPKHDAEFYAQSRTLLSAALDALNTGAMLLAANWRLMEMTRRQALEVLILYGLTGAEAHAILEAQERT